jgi:hypothetical protein
MTTSATFQVMLEGRKIEEHVFLDDQVVGLWSKAIEAYTDSFASPRSWNGQFRDLYEGGRLAATAILAAAGYRAKGLDHHHTAITAAAELSPDKVADGLYAIEGARGNRHDTNYGSADVADQDDVAEIRAAVEILLSDGAKHLRSLRPSAQKRIRVTRPRGRKKDDAASAETDTPSG